MDYGYRFKFLNQKDNRLFTSFSSIVSLAPSRCYNRPRVLSNKSERNYLKLVIKHSCEEELTMVGTGRAGG